MIAVIRGARVYTAVVDCGRASQKDKARSLRPQIIHRVGRGLSVLAGSSGMEKLFLRPILGVGVEIS